MVLTVGVLGYLVREGLDAGEGPPELSVSSQTAKATNGGFVVPLIVSNDSTATAAEVQVRGVLEMGGTVFEERFATFAYVPGRGEARGGIIFQRDPGRYQLRLSTEGYEEP
ncbi:hypothetical protein LJR225_004057 [Phenylobacterium sp. LjRoot225]|uniref:hypothetical protein n=1 Tax=Phenylobacterium sp. LjRoot225 TaxID=3342285 RepID=UPI003ECD100E